jgi:hypothetical protein
VTRQYLAEDWPFHHAQCYDDAGLARFQGRLAHDLSGMITEQVDEICVHPVQPADRKLFITEMAKCSAEVRSEIMEDHTRADWRDFLQELRLPTLVLAGKKD